MIDSFGKGETQKQANKPILPVLCILTCFSVSRKRFFRFWSDLPQISLFALVLLPIIWHTPVVRAGFAPV